MCIKFKFAFFLKKKFKTLMKVKKISLVIDHTSWWKRKKYRKESCQILKDYKLKGWKLKKITKIKGTLETIDTRTFRAYFLQKKVKV